MGGSGEKRVIETSGKIALGRCHSLIAEIIKRSLLEGMTYRSQNPTLNAEQD